MAMQRKRRRRSGGSNNNNNPNRHFESNGPDVRIRGSAQQVLEKYLQYARDAQTAGDRIKAEGLFQHAEHYARIVATFERQKEEERREREEREAKRDEGRANRDSDDSDDDESDSEDTDRVDASSSDTRENDDADAQERPKRRGRRPKTEIKVEESHNGANGHDEMATEERGDESDDKPKRRRRSYTPKSTDDGVDDGVMKTLSRGADDTDTTAPAESDA